MKEALRAITQSAKFTLPIFGGVLQIEGRILSPAETEAAGLTSSMIATEMIPKNKKAQGGFASLQARIAGRKFEDLEDSLVEELIKAMGTIRPESITKMEQAQDRLLTQIVQRASSDDGKTWERLILVTAVDQQNADNGRLWVGMLSKEDRQAILDQALTGHKEATARLATFRK